MLLLGCQCQRLNLVHGVEIRIYKLQRLFFRLINLRVNLRELTDRSPNCKIRRLPVSVKYFVPVTLIAENYQRWNSGKCDTSLPLPKP